MKALRIVVVVFAALAAGQFSLQATLRAADGPYKQVAEIKIGGEGGWDYLSVDSAARRLYVSHATKVVVIDMDKNTVVGEIAPASGVHGIALAPDLGLGFVSNGRDNTASVVDLKTLKITATVKTGLNPDCILYEPGHREVYTFNGRSNDATVFDASTGDVKATIKLPGKPEFAQVDVKAGRIYNNIEDTDEIVAIDTATHAVVAKWPIKPAEGASGLALDLANHRLYAVTDKLMAVVDSTSGKLLSTFPIGGGPDAAAYDAGTGLVFASNSDGTMTVAKASAAGTLTLVQTIVTPARSRTMTLDPKTHRVYIAAAEYGAPGAPGADGRPARPTIVAGSFRVVVFEMTAATK
ncbi:MAG: YncE family protein [Acidobacteriota bacterium]